MSRYYYRLNRRLMEGDRLKLIREGYFAGSYEAHIDDGDISAPDSIVVSVEGKVSFTHYASLATEGLIGTKAIISLPGGDAEFVIEQRWPSKTGHVLILRPNEGIPEHFKMLGVTSSGY